MEVQVEESGPCRRSMTIKVPAEKIKEHVDKVFATASQQVDIKGFRAGKVPRKVLEQRFGDAILAEAKESLVHESFQSACRDKEINFIGQPQLSGIDEAPLDQKSAFEFKVDVDVRPSFELQRVKGIEVKDESTDVTDEDVDAGVDQLANEKRSLQTVEEPVEAEDFVTADLTFKKDGESVHARKGAQMHPNIPVAGSDADAFKNSLIGAEKGSTISVELTFPDSFEKEAVRGQDGTVEIEIHEVKRLQAPPIDDEFAKGFEFDTLDALKDKLRERIGQEKVQGNQNRIEQTIIETILKENPFEVPASMVADQKARLLERLVEQMKKGGLDEGQIEAEKEKLGGEAEQQAEQSVRVFFLFDSIARQEKIFVIESEMTVELRNIAAANNVTVEEARTYYESNDLMGDLRLSIMERKVRDFLRDNAKITDK